MTRQILATKGRDARASAQLQPAMPESTDEDLLSRIGRIVDRAFAQRILRQSEADRGIEVTRVSIRPATAKGDNYTSDMFRAHVKFRSGGSGEEEDARTLIVKTEPLLAGVHQQLIAKSSLFATEIAMMTDTLARMNELLGGGAPLNGRGLYTQSEAPPLLVIEDLAPLGFRMADRQAGLDMDHCLLAVRNLARFHAASVALCERDPGQAERYARGLFHRDQPPEMRQFFVRGARQLAREAAAWPELDPKIPEKLSRLADVIYERGCEASEPREHEFKVINHGDFWVNNMLFRYNESARPVAHIFVDFQLCVHTSPGLDLNYFFNTSLTDDTLRLNEDTLLHEYARCLATAMRAVGCRAPSPSLEQVRGMVRERAAYGMVAAFTVLPIIMVDKSQARDLNELMADGPDAELVNPAYQSALFRKAMLDRLPKFDAMGLLD